MSRASALAAASAAILLVLAQDAFPQTGFYHTWQYAALLSICAVVFGSYGYRALGGADGAVGRRLALACGGAFLVLVAGLVSGLMGPDTVTVARAPGTVAPLPDLGAAAFFTQAGPRAIAGGDAPVVVRRPGQREVTLLPGQRAYIGAAVLWAQRAPAAFIEARDATGHHLTVTQPSNAGFLSPVLLFRDRQLIGDRRLPVDGFELPAVGRSVKVVFFSGHETQTLKSHPELAGQPAILFAVDDDRGHPLGITLATSGSEVSVAGVRLRAALGAYPVLAIGAAPLPLPLLLGLAIFVAGLLWAFLGPRERGAAEPATPRLQPSGEEDTYGPMVALVTATSKLPKPVT